eukprot:6694680-Prorocentrum_lima.AAC.1
MVVPPPPGREPMTGSAANAASTTGQHAQSAGIVLRGVLRRRAAGPLRALLRATRKQAFGPPSGGKG